MGSMDRLSICSSCFFDSIEIAFALFVLIFVQQLYCCKCTATVFCEHLDFPDASFVEKTIAFM